MPVTIPNRKDIKRLQEIDMLIESDELEEALKEALAFTRKRPKLVEAWGQLALIAQDLDSDYYMWTAIRMLNQLEPHDEMHSYNLAVASAKMNLVFLAQQAVTRYMKRFPDGIHAAKIMDLQQILEAQVAALIDSGDVPADVVVDDVALFEMSKLIISHGEYREGRKLALQCAKKLPYMAVAALNNVALSYTIEGKLTKALDVTNDILAEYPDNLFAGGAKAQLLVRLGEADAARALLNNLQQQTSSNTEHWIKVVEACAFAHEHQMVLDIYGRIRQSFDGSSSGTVLIDHLAGTAYAFLGDTRQAKTAWRKALRSDPAHKITAQNMQHFEEHGPWYFEFQNWIPKTWLEEVLRTLNRTAKRTGNTGVREIERLFTRIPGLKPSLSLLLERGDPDALKFALGMAQQYPFSGLAEFIKGTRGTDEDRMLAVRFATAHGLVSKMEPMQAFMDGELREIMQQEFEIYDEPVEPEIPLPEAAQMHLQNSFMAVNEEQYELALEETEKGLAIAPGTPSLLNHKANALIMLGRWDEADAINRQLVKDHPDYLFGRLALADMCIREDRLDQAYEWLEPILSRQRLHISEFRALALTSIRYWHARGELEGAKHWLQMLDNIDPDSVPESWREGLVPLDKLIATGKFTERTKKKGD